MPRAEKYFIGPQLLGDIRRVVGRVDAEPQRSDVTRIPTQLQDMRRPDGVFRVCTFTGAWNLNVTKTVTLRGVTTTPNTVSALNLFARIPEPLGVANCAIARDGASWYVIAAQCSTAT
jgi:hypothetical protein